MRNETRSRRFALAVAGVMALSLLAVPGFAQRAARGAPNQCRARLQQFIRDNNLQHYEKNGVTYFALPGRASIKDPYLQACGSNVVEFFKQPRGSAKYHHLYTRVGKTTWSRVWSLGSSPWYPTQYGERIGVLCELKPQEMDKFNQFLTHNSRSPNSTHPLGNIGSFDVNGGGANATHCTNYLSRAKIGENGQSLPRVLGKSGTGIAPSWIRGLAQSGGERVIGVAVHNPREFGPNVSLEHFFN